MVRTCEIVLARVEKAVLDSGDASGIYDANDLTQRFEVGVEMTKRPTLTTP